MPKYFSFDPETHPPHPLPPPLSCDSQFHVFGPAERFPVRPGAVYEMPTATWEVARRMHRILGVQRGVVVQAATYGADHAVVVDALTHLNASGTRTYMGCANAAVFKEKDDAYLETLHSAGVRGARFTRGGFGINFTPAELSRALSRLRELGWYVKIQPELDGVLSQVAPFERVDLPVVLDHMGRPNPSLGGDCPTLKKIVELLKRGNFWVVLSVPERISRLGAPWDDVLPIAQALIEAAPERCLWGTDWPHPVATHQPPNDGDLLQNLYRFAGSTAQITKILVENPARLFGFQDA